MTRVLRVLGETPSTLATACGMPDWKHKINAMCHRPRNADLPNVYADPFFDNLEAVIDMRLAGLLAVKNELLRLRAGHAAKRAMIEAEHMRQHHVRQAPKET